jgi:antirestriction protein ArdC
MEEKVEKRDVYTIINNRIVEQLEQGIVPWRQPWKEAGPPMNLISRKPYRGINVMLLGSLGYNLNCFLTFKQVKSLGGTVIKGEKSCPVVFWKVEEKVDELTKEKTNTFILRYHNVFNIAQCEEIYGYKVPIPELRPNNPIEICEKIINEMPLKPRFKNDMQKAYYSPDYDYISIPQIEAFESSEAYYGTLFHELIHSTGHSTRLNRKEIVEMRSFASESYSVEELTAEIGSCFLGSIAGIEKENMSNNVAYIQSWLRQLKNDKKFIFYASSNAQKAVDFILGVKHEQKTGITVEREEVTA